jgi:hypothetical protein
LATVNSECNDFTSFGYVASKKISGHIVHLVLTSCLIARTRTSSSTMLNTSDYTSCIFPDFTEKIFTISLFCVMLAMDLSYGLYCVEELPILNL